MKFISRIRHCLLKVESANLLAIFYIILAITTSFTIYEVTFSASMDVSQKALILTTFLSSVMLFSTLANSFFSSVGSQKAIDISELSAITGIIESYCKKINEKEEKISSLSIKEIFDFRNIEEISRYFLNLVVLLKKIDVNKKYVSMIEMYLSEKAIKEVKYCKSLYEFVKYNTSGMKEHIDDVDSKATQIEYYKKNFYNDYKRVYDNFVTACDFMYGNEKSKEWHSNVKEYIDDPFLAIKSKIH